MKYLLIALLLGTAGCGSCRCTPEIEENEKLIVPPELRTIRSSTIQAKAEEK